MSDTDDKELKLLFIEEELSQHGDWLCEAFTEAIEREKIIRTGDLYDSINYKRFREGDNPGLRVNFYFMVALQTLPLTDADISTSTMWIPTVMFGE
ncbi:hypothetical protein EZS27_037510 [termite gut metagenome]|uniref:Uncharacterized protein n=1 Tax=termite gut metagenome TaxID=433724 RepID=A0A5J4PSR6_9ZZZZ